MKSTFLLYYMENVHWIKKKSNNSLYLITIQDFFYQKGYCY